LNKELIRSTAGCDITEDQMEERSLFLRNRNADFRNKINHTSVESNHIGYHFIKFRRVSDSICNYSESGVSTPSFPAPNFDNDEILPDPSNMEQRPAAIPPVITLPSRHSPSNLPNDSLSTPSPDFEPTATLQQDDWDLDSNHETHENKMSDKESLDGDSGSIFSLSTADDDDEDEESDTEHTSVNWWTHHKKSQSPDGDPVPKRSVTWLVPEQQPIHQHPCPTDNIHHPNCDEGVHPVQAYVEPPVVATGSFSAESYHKLKPVKHRQLNTTLEWKMGVLVCQLLTHVQVPAVLYDQLFRIITSCLRNCPRASLNLHIISRRSLIDQLQRDYPGPKPMVATVELEPDIQSHETIVGEETVTSRRCSVVKMDFMEQLIDLFSDRELFGNLSNFKGVLNVSDPNDPDKILDSAPPCDRDDTHCNPEYIHANEIQNANWYRATHAECKEIAGDVPFICAPWLIHIDKTLASQNQRQTVEPVSICCGLVNKATRNLSQSWRLLGIIPSSPSLEKAVSHQRDGVNVARGRPTRDFHRCLEEILKSLVDNQGYKEPLFVEIQIGNCPPRVVRLFNPVAFVIGDCVAQDTHVGRFGSFASQVKTVCHACYIPPAQCPRPNHQCQFRHPHDTARHNQVALHHSSYRHTIVMSPDLILDEEPTEEEINESIQQMDSKSMHIVANGFRHVHFGVQPYGIFGATPHDVFHLLLQGLFKYALLSIMGRLSSTLKKKLDRAGRAMCKSIRGDFGREFPRLNFTKRISVITMLTGEDRVGMCSVLLLLIMKEDGCAIFDKANDDLVAKCRREGNPMPKKAIAETIVEGLDCLLSLYSWYRYTESFVIPKVDLRTCQRKELEEHFRSNEYTQRMRQVIEMFVRCFPRPREKKDVVQKEYNIQNLHSLLHIPRDIFLFGSPMNTDAGVCEKNLKALAKNPAKNALKTEQKFEESLANRISELTSIDKAAYSFTGRWGPARDLAERQVDDIVTMVTNSDPLFAADFRDNALTREEYIRNKRHKRDVLLSCRPIMELQFSDSSAGYQVTGDMKNESTVFYLHEGIAEYLAVQWGAMRKEIKKQAEREGVHPLSSEDLNQASWYSIHKTFEPGETFRAHPNHTGRGFWSWVMYDFFRNGKSSPCLVCGFFRSKKLGTKYAMIANTVRVSSNDDETYTPASGLCEKYMFHYTSLPQERVDKRHPGKTLYLPYFQFISVESLEGKRKEVVVTDSDPSTLLRPSFDWEEIEKRNRFVIRLKRMRTEWGPIFSDSGGGSFPEEHSEEGSDPE